MLMVIKSSGSKQLFEIEKVKSSLAATSDEAHQPLNESDLNAITRELLIMLDGKEQISSRHIYIMIIGILYASQMYEIVKFYTNHLTNQWKNIR